MLARLSQKGPYIERGGGGEGLPPYGYGPPSFPARSSTLHAPRPVAAARQSVGWGTAVQLYSRQAVFLPSLGMAIFCFTVLSTAGSLMPVRAGGRRGQGRRPFVKQARHFALPFRTTERNDYSMLVQVPHLRPPPPRYVLPLAALLPPPSPNIPPPPPFSPHRRARWARRPPPPRPPPRRCC